MLIKGYFNYEGPWSDAQKELLCMNTGSWRTKRPVINPELCIDCGFCSLYCPVQCMTDAKEYFTGDLNFCKGCGICANECPRKAIEMKPEADFLN